jgi:hypothetical protein
MGFEHGPFLAQADGTLLMNSLSWNKFATMVYFEQPVGVGFSYSSNPADYQSLDDAVAASDNSAFLSAFFQAHPQYQSLPLFLTSESYGGNYVPQMTRAVLEGTDARLQAQLMKGGFAVGNPVFSIDDVNATFANIMNAVQAEIFYGHSLIPLSFFEKFSRAGCNALNPPSTPCDDLNNEMISLAGACFGGNACGDDMYADPFGNATLGVATTPTNDVSAAWTKYLNLASVQAAIHAKPPRAPWDDCSNIGYDVTWPSSVPDYLAAFQANLRILVFSGDVDVSTCPFSSTQVAVDTLSQLAGGELKSNWTSWEVTGLGGLAAGQTGGYIETHKAFTFASVKGAGHESPGFQPLASFQLMRAFVTGTLDQLAAVPTPAPTPAVEEPAARKLTQSSILRAAVARTLAKQRASKA